MNTPGGLSGASYSQRSREGYQPRYYGSKSPTSSTSKVHGYSSSSGSPSDRRSPIQKANVTFELPSTASYIISPTPSARTDSPASRRTDSPASRRTDSPASRRTDSPTPSRAESPGSRRVDYPTLGITPPSFGVSSSSVPSLIPMYTPSVLDQSRSLDTTPLDESWIDAGQNIQALFVEELETLKAMSPDAQLNYLKVWFEDCFMDSMSFSYITSVLKTILGEHCIEVSVHREYQPVELLLLLKQTLGNNKRNCIKLELEIAEITASLTQKMQLEMGNAKEHKRCMQELMDGMSARLLSANERAINARQQIAGLQDQLAEALERIDQMEGRRDGICVKDVRMDRTFSPKRPDSGQEKIPDYSYIEEMEQSIASGDAKCASLQSELSRERAVSERLRSYVRESSQRIASLEGELSATQEESLHKTRLLTTSYDEMIESFEAHISKHLLDTSLHNLTPEDDVFMTWSEELQRATNEKGENVSDLVKLLASQEYHLNNVKLRVAEKQKKIEELEQRSISLTEQLSQKKVQLEMAEIDVNEVYEELMSTQRGLDLMTQERREKQAFLDNLIKEIGQMDMELSQLNTFRALLTGRKEEDSNIVFRPKYLQDLLASFSSDGSGSSYLSSMCESAFKPSCTLNSSFPITSTPIKIMDSTLPGSGKVKLQTSMSNAISPIQLNVSLAPSGTSDSIECRAVLNDARDISYVRPTGVGPITPTPVRYGSLGRPPAVRRKLLGKDYSAIMAQNFTLPSYTPRMLWDVPRDFPYIPSPIRNDQGLLNRTHEIQKTPNIGRAFLQEDMNKTAERLAAFRAGAASASPHTPPALGSTYIADSPYVNTPSMTSPQLNRTF